MKYVLIRHYTGSNKDVRAFLALESSDDLEYLLLKRKGWMEHSSPASKYHVAKYDDLDNIAMVINHGGNPWKLVLC